MHVFFRPWIGKNYQSGGIFQKKILVVGESHYCDGCEECGLKFKPQGCDALNTSGVVREFLDGCKSNWTKTFTKFERSLVNKECVSPHQGGEIRLTNTALCQFCLQYGNACLYYAIVWNVRKK